MVMYTSNKEKWDRLASTWVDAGPPASPSDEDIENYKSLLLEGLGRAQAGRILVLGSTPRLRDMLCGAHELRKFTIDCVDISEQMYLRTSQSTLCHNPNERLVVSDWLTMELGKHQFHAVLGDKVIDNVHPENWVALLRRVYYHLRRSGCFIVRLAPQNTELRGVTFNSALEKWAGRYQQNAVSLAGAASGFWEELLGASAFQGEERHKTQKTARFSDDLEASLAQFDLLDQNYQAVLNEFIRVFWASREDEWSSYDYDEILGLMGKYFRHGRTIYSTDYAAGGLQPIICMRAKHLRELNNN
jgi:hypothetical protein